MERERSREVPLGGAAGMAGEQARGSEPRTGDGSRKNVDLIPPEFLHVIAIWSIVPAYLIMGAFFGWLLDRWLGTAPYLMGLALLAALALAVRDMYRLRNEFQSEADRDAS